MAPSHKSKATRLLTLIHRIAAEPGKSAQVLARETGRTSRTIFRDLSELQEAGFPLYNDRGYRFSSDGFLPTMGLDPEELFALFVGVRTVEAQAQHELGSAGRRALEKLCRVSPESSRPDLSGMRDAIHVADPTEETGMERLQALQNYLSTGNQISISYQGLKDEEMTERVVDPMGLFCFRQVWYLRAYDHLRSGLRSFRLSRIINHRLLETPVVHQPEMDLREAVTHRWEREGQTPARITLQVTPSLRRWLEENPPHPSQKVEGEQVTYQASDFEAVARWLASLYGVEILEPEELKVEMRMLISRLQKLYGSERTDSDSISA